MPRVGVIGSLVWDEIHGRDATAGVVEEWGGIAYALASFDASLPEGWEIVPLIKVGADLAGRSREFLGSLRRLEAGARCVEVPAANNRVVLYYESAERRTERMAGGVPAWSWAELGPMVRDLDAIYLNFISGFELALGTAQALRQGFAGPLYADLHSLLFGMHGDGIRELRPLPDAPSWFGCFDVIQVNEEEMNQLGPDPLSLAAAMLGVGVSALIVTLGPRGAVYVSGGAVRRCGGAAEPSAAVRRRGGAAEPSAAVRRCGGAAEGGGAVSHTVQTALVPAEPVLEPLDPTGCGDVFGAAVFSRLLAGEPVADAVAAGNRVAARNVSFRGASGLAQHLRGELVAP